MKAQILFLLITATLLASCARKPEPETASQTMGEEAKKQTEIAQEQLRQAEQAAEKVEAEKQKMEEATALKEAADKALNAPIRAGEFQLTISPDRDIASAFGVPVHVFSTSSDMAAQFKSIGADAYFSGGRQSSNAQKLTFGSSGKGGPVSLESPRPHWRRHSHRHCQLTKTGRRRRPCFHTSS